MKTKKTKTEVSRVVAEGEATGHAHRVSKRARVEVIDGTHRRLIATGESVITHEEHKTLTIKKGTYQTGIVREIDPLEDEIREVRD